MNSKGEEITTTRGTITKKKGDLYRYRKNRKKRVGGKEKRKTKKKIDRE